MDTLFSLKVFREVVQQGSFTRAADKLDISIAMASKHVSHLENSIHAKLLHRNSRNLHLTEAGEEYYRQCSYALETLDTAAERAASGTDTPQGLLRITMPQWFANSRMADCFAEYRRRYPEVTLELSLDNRKIDLIADGFDMALRVSSDPQPSLIVKPLTEIRFFSGGLARLPAPPRRAGHLGRSGATSGRAAFLCGHGHGNVHPQRRNGSLAAYIAHAQQQHLDAAQADSGRQRHRLYARMAGGQRFESRLAGAAFARI